MAETRSKFLESPAQHDTRPAETTPRAPPALTRRGYAFRLPSQMVSKWSASAAMDEPGERLTARTVAPTLPNSPPKRFEAAGLLAVVSPRFESENQNDVASNTNNLISRSFGCCSPRNGKFRSQDGFRGTPAWACPKAFL
jgi:hypothetical protein